MAPQNRRNYHKRGESKGSLSELDYERTAVEFKISSRTLLRWKKLYVEKGVAGLVPKKAPGRKARPITGYTAKKIRRYRECYTWGAEVINAHLRLDDGINISEGRIHRFLSRKGFIEHKQKMKNNHRHTTVVRVEDPGAHTQTDVKHLPRILRNKTKSWDEQVYQEHMILIFHSTHDPFVFLSLDHQISDPDTGSQTRRKSHRQLAAPLGDS